MPETLDVRLANRLEEIPRLAREIEAFAERHGLPAPPVHHLNLALDEMITNIVSYGYGDDAEHVIELLLVLEDGALRAELADDASPFDPLKDSRPPVLDLPPEKRPIGGLGLHFVKTLMDDVRYRRDGRFNRLTLVKRLAT